MPRYENSDERLLRVADILRQQACEYHGITTGEIQTRLSELGILCSIKIIRRDIKHLQEMDFIVCSENDGRSRKYWIDWHGISWSEFRFIVDCLHANSCLPDSKFDGIISTLRILGKDPGAKEWNTVVWSNKRKHSNVQVVNTLQNVLLAIEGNKQCSFQYYHLDEFKRKQFRHNGERYVVRPVAQFINEDNYYLVALDTKTNEVRYYRLDRIEYAQVEEAPSNITDEIRSRCYDDYQCSVFNMYEDNQHRRVPVTLEFTRRCLDPVYDKFGEGVKVIPHPAYKDTFWIKVNVSPSITFFKFVFGFDGNMKIIDPPEIRNEYKKALERAMDNI